LAQRSASMTRDMQVHRDGHTRVLRAFCQTLNDHAGNEIGNVLQLRDVSERVLIEDRMRRMERYMGLGSLAGGLHHEIKNPLAALSLHVQLLEEELEGDDPSDEVRQMLGVIRTEVTRIGGVLEGFRDFASIGQLNLGPVELNELVLGQVSLVKPSATQASIRIDFEHEDGECFVLADRVRLEQVLLNLLVNAMEAMPEGGTIIIRTRQSGEFAVVEVEDMGVGIPENLQDRILDPYFTTKSGGTGLGLALCDKVMRQHRGNLEFQTSEKGTTFVLTIPKAPVESSQGS
jgi:two-component system nitrogen regulation sensor histidine kinase GlnL